MRYLLLMLQNLPKYKTLMYSAQSLELETLGKLNAVRRMARTLMEKLKGIKADLVRGRGGGRRMTLKKWKIITPVEYGDSYQKSKRYDRKSELFHAKSEPVFTAIRMIIFRKIVQA